MYLNNPIEPNVWKALSGQLRQIPTVGSVVYYFPKLHHKACGDAGEGENLPVVLTAEVRSVKLRANATLGQDIFVKFRLKALDEHAPAAGEWMAPIDPAIKYSTMKLTDNDARESSCYIKKATADAIFPNMKPHQPGRALYVTDIGGDKWILKQSLDEDKVGHKIGGNWKEFIRGRGIAGGSKIVFIKKSTGNQLIVGFKKGGIGAHPPHGEARLAVEDLTIGGACAMAIVRYYPIGGEEYVVLKSAVEEAAHMVWQEAMQVKVGRKLFTVEEANEDAVGPLLTVRGGGNNLSHVRPWKATPVEQ